MANIPDERDKEGYTQVYRYTHNLFSDMYENPNEYRLYPPENVMFYGVAYYGNLLIDIVKSSELMEDGTLMMAASVYHKMLKKGVRKKDDISYCFFCPGCCPSLAALSDERKRPKAAK